MVVHCASMGEFEHIKPFLVGFKKQRPEFKIIVVFFSPSGFRNVNSFKPVDLFLYTPFDWFFPMMRFFLATRPTVWVVAKHDVWPNQLWVATLFRIPVFLINASFHPQSKKFVFYLKLLYKLLYTSFKKILTASRKDKKYFALLARRDKIVIAGDTKFDQVLFRKDESLKKKYLLPLKKLDRYWIFVAGSTWPEDHKHLLPAIKDLQNQYDQFFSVICPHEITRQHINELVNYFGQEKSILFSRLGAYSKERIIIVDRMGLLANLYQFGKVAYVGGSFHQNVHNVLEAAVYSIPVLMGPVNLNSNEAQLLKIAGGGFEVKNTEEMKRVLEKFIVNDIHRQECGRKAYRVVDDNKGATKITIETILNQLPG